MSSQLAVGANVQQRVQVFAEQREAEGKSKPGAVVSSIEPSTANEPDEFETRRRLFFAGTKNAS
jgi:hypothetical protein